MRFVIEEFEVAWRPGHKQVDDTLGLGFEMRFFRREQIVHRRGGPALLAEECAERNGAEANTALLEKPSASDQFRIVTAIEMGLIVHDYSFVIVSSRFSSTRDTVA